MRLTGWISAKKYYYDVFLRPLPLLSQAHVLCHRLKNQLVSRNVPNTLVLGLTYRCQLTCIHCGVRGYYCCDREELTKKEIFRIILQAHQLGVYFIVFFGGEPFLRTDILEVIEYAKKKRIIIAISTNGLLLQPDVIYRIKQKGISFLNVSLDSADASTHDCLRQLAGSFKKTLTAIRQCVNNNLAVIISTYATKENIRNGDIKDIISLARKVGAKGVRILLAIPTGAWLKCPEVILSEEEKKIVFGLLDPEFVYIEGVCNTLTECSTLSKELFYISPYGDVQPCNFVPLSFGNIRKEPLTSIWQRMIKHDIYQMVEKGDCIMRNPRFRQEYVGAIEKSDRLPLVITS